MPASEKIITQLTFFDNLDIQEAVTQIQLLSKANEFSYVITPNIDHLARLCGKSKDSELVLTYHQAALSLCDSRILEKMLGLVGKKPKAVIPGSDLTYHLFELVLNKNDHVLVVGGSDSDIDSLRKKYSHLNISHINPSMGFINKPEEVEALVKEVEGLAAHYVFLAVGSPRQEILAAKIRQSSAIGVGLCIGASINFLVGKEVRAPIWMQKLHIEWLYRMLQDPKRLVRRYVMNAVWLPKIYWRLK